MKAICISCKKAHGLKCPKETEKRRRARAKEKRFYDSILAYRAQRRAEMNLERKAS